MTLAFVVGIVGYLVGMLHGKRLSAPRLLVRGIRNHNGGMQIGWSSSVEDDVRQILVNTQYNAHPPVS